MKSPKAPKKTQQQEAQEVRQRSLLDEEIEEQEERLRALSRGTLGRSSLLSGAPKTVKQAAGSAPRTGIGATASAGLLGGASGSPRASTPSAGAGGKAGVGMRSTK